MQRLPRVPGIPMVEAEVVGTEQHPDPQECADMTRSNIVTALGFGVVALTFVLQSTVACSFEDPRDRNSYGT